MKGSIGSVSGGVRGAGVGAGMRASGGISARSFGPSLSPEARFGSASSKFSSRGLSNFNRSPIGFKEIGGKKSSNSIVNINRGKETKSKFARTPSLARQSSMFDMSRPVRSHPVSRPSEFGVRINLKNGREAKSSKARVNNLTSPRPMFDKTRPHVPEFGKRLRLGKVENIQKPRPIERNFAAPRKVDTRVRPILKEARKTVAQRTREVGFNPRIRSERVKSVSPFKDTVILWQRSDVSPRQKFEHAAKVRVSIEGVRLTRKERRSHIKRKRAEIDFILRNSETNQIQKMRTESAPKRKTEKAKVPKRLKIGNMIHISHDASPEVRNLIRHDIKEVKNILIPFIMKAKGVSYATAVQEAVQVLAKKHEGKVRVLPMVHLQIEAKTETQSQISGQAKTEIKQIVKPEVQAQAQKTSTEVVPPKEKKPAATSQTEQLLYFKKDTAANESRQNRFKEAYKKLLHQKKREDKDITSLDVFGAAGNPHTGEMSEITRPWGFDYQYGNFLYAAKLMASIFSNPKDFLAFLGITIRLHSAIKLSTKEDANAKGKDAMQVYGRSLDEVGAYVEELKLTGELTADGLASKVRIIRNGKKEVIYEGANKSYIPQAA